jgi:hypothetical protein
MVIWPWAGTAFGVLSPLYALGTSTSSLVTQFGKLFTISADGTTLVVSAPVGGRWYFDGGSPLKNPVAWTLSTAFSAAPASAIPDVVVPSPQNGFYYTCELTGVSGAVQPTWTTAVGSFVGDGTCLWQCKGRDFWSRFAVIFFAPFPSSWGGSPPADGSQEQLRVRNLVRQWKPADATCVTIGILTGGQSWDYRPAGATWDSHGQATWDSNSAITFWTP